MTFLNDNPDEVAELRDAGYTITTDDELVDAVSDHYGLSRDSARLFLGGGPPEPDGDVIVDV